jgi:pimeloyl-ACP methyl ester carboxylesterase
VSQIQPHSLATIQGDQAKTRSAAWRKIPSAYLICEQDNAIPAQGQEAMALGVREAGGTIDIERIPSSHSPHLSQPGVVADFLRRAVEKVQ